jgi:hypothetical protein
MLQAVLMVLTGMRQTPLAPTAPQDVLSVEMPQHVMSVQTLQLTARVVSDGT